jgi:hypothetical protein
MKFIDKLVVFFIAATPIVAQTITTAPKVTKVRLKQSNLQLNGFLFRLEAKTS